MVASLMLIVISDSGRCVSDTTGNGIHEQTQYISRADSIDDATLSCEFWKIYGCMGDPRNGDQDRSKHGVYNRHCRLLRWGLC